MVIIMQIIALLNAFSLSRGAICDMTGWSLNSGCARCDEQCADGSLVQYCVPSRCPPAPSGPVMNSPDCDNNGEFVSAGPFTDRNYETLDSLSDAFVLFDVKNAANGFLHVQLTTESPFYDSTDVDTPFLQIYLGSDRYAMSKSAIDYAKFDWYCGLPGLQSRQPGYGCNPYAWQQSGAQFQELDSTTAGPDINTDTPHRFYIKWSQANNIIEFGFFSSLTSPDPQKLLEAAYSAVTNENFVNFHVQTFRYYSAQYRVIEGCVSCENEYAYLSDLPVVDQTAGWGGEGAGINNWMGHNTMLMGNDRTYNKFLVIHPTHGTSPNAFRSFALGGNYKRFSAVVGSARSSNGCESGYGNYGSFSIEILVDGVRKYYRDGYGRTGFDIVNIDITGANLIKIETDNGGGDWTCDHPAIADPLLSTCDNEEWTDGLTLGYGDNKYNGELIDIGRDEFNELFQNSRYFIVKRECSSCADDYKEIYYKRLTNPESFDVYGYMQSWRSANNIINQDFALYSTLNDALSGKNSWQFCNYDDVQVGAFRDCGKTVAVACQWTSSYTNSDRNWNNCNRPSKFSILTANAIHGAAEPIPFNGFWYEGIFSSQTGTYVMLITTALLVVNIICLGIFCFSTNKNKAKGYKVVKYDSEVTDA